MQPSEDEIRESTMKRYATSTPRATFAAGAAVLTALTMGMAVAVPAVHDGRCDRAWVASGPPATEVAIEPARIEVVAIREAVGPMAAVSLRTVRR
jgi:hypothetical protein